MYVLDILYAMNSSQNPTPNHNHVKQRNGREIRYSSLRNYHMIYAAKGLKPFREDRHIVHVRRMRELESVFQEKGIISLGNHCYLKVKICHSFSWHKSSLCHIQHVDIVPKHRHQSTRRRLGHRE